MGESFLKVDYEIADGRTGFGAYLRRLPLAEIVSLSISGLYGKDNRISALPECLYRMPRLERLEIRDCPLGTIPAEIANLQSIRALDFFNCRLSSLPAALADLPKLEEFGIYDAEGVLTQALVILAQCKNLRKLTLANGKLRQPPGNLYELYGLAELDLNCDRLEVLEPAVGRLKNLKTLDVFGKLKSLPESIGDLVDLEVLRVPFSRLKAIPGTIAGLKCLRVLDLSHNDLAEIPAGILALPNLEELDLRGNGLAALPGNMERLAKLRRLDLGYNKLTALPAGLEKLGSLESFDLRGNEHPDLHRQARELCRLKAKSLVVEPPFTEMEMSGRDYEKIRLLDRGGIDQASAAWLQSLPHLRELTIDVADRLPEEICGLAGLKVLDCHDCGLTGLPKNIDGLKSLEEFNLQGNELDDLPESFARLENLARLNLELADGLALRGLPRLRSLSLVVRNGRLADIFDDFPDLTELDLFLPHLEQLPASFYRLRSLQSLHLMRSDCLDLQDTFLKLGALPALKHLRVSKLDRKQELAGIPKAIAGLKHIETLRLEEFWPAPDPEQLPDFSGLTALKLLAVDPRATTEAKKLIKARLPGGGQGWHLDSKEGGSGHLRYERIDEALA